MSKAQILQPPVYFIKGQHIILDADLAKLLGTETKRLNEICKRNSKKFIGNSRFQLSRKELVAARSQFATLKFKADRKLPYVYTIHGAIFALDLLNTKKSAEISVSLVRLFVELMSTEIFENKLKKFENKYDKSSALFFNTVKTMLPNNSD